MAARVHVRHPQTGAVIEVAASAVPMLAASGWVPLDADEVAARAERRRADKTAAEQTMTPTPPAPVRKITNAQDTTDVVVKDPAPKTGRRHNTKESD